MGENVRTESREDKLIGIIGAMHEEVQTIIKATNIQKASTKANMMFHEGTLHDKEVVVVKSGVGKVNAGMCAQILIDDYKADTIINLGVAGAINKNIDVCDIVISARAVQHDFTTGIIDECEVGEIPNINTRYFNSDKGLADKTFESAKELNLNATIGTIATGDQFICDKDKKEYLEGEFEADCCEMEGGAIAQVCYLNRVPFVIIRSISDKADGNATKTYEEFIKKSAENSAKLVESLISKL